MGLGWFDLGSDYDEEKQKLKDMQKANTLQSAQSSAMMGANAIGQQAAQDAAAAATSAGATRGSAETLAQNAGNVASNDAIAGQTQAALQAQRDAESEQEKNIAEAQAEREEKLGNLQKVSDTLQTAGGTALSAVNPALGLGASALASVGKGALSKYTGKDGAGGTAARIANTLLSDERLKRVSRIKNPRLRK